MSEGPKGPTPWREPTMHYSRAEREAMRSHQSTPQSGFFRRNRALVILLLDLVFVTALFLIYLFFLRPMALRVQIDSYTVSAQAVVADGEVAVIVTVVAGEGDAPQAPQPIVRATVGSLEVADLAPLAGRSRDLIIALGAVDDVPVARSGFESAIEVEVSIGAEGPQTVRALWRPESAQTSDN